MRIAVSTPARAAPAPLLCTGGALDVEELYRLHARTVARWAARLGGPGVDVEDVVQEVFLVAKRRLRSFTGAGSVTTWLFRTTANVAAAARRKQRLRRWLGRVPAPEAPGMSAPGQLPGEALELLMPAPRRAGRRQARAGGSRRQICRGEAMTRMRSSRPSRQTGDRSRGRELPLSFSRAVAVAQLRAPAPPVVLGSTNAGSVCGTPST